jgi:hypothetical protein
MNIPIGIVGKIIAGNEQGRYVKIIDDDESTGGYLILTSSSPNFRDGHDSWVQDHETLVQFFKESRWIVDWKPAEV